ncbi:electron transport complex subunit E [Enterococcus hirae]|jgi:electron transport complex protein RnfE|nr:electron transport complex subunit E [Enterococcaceae bacterium]MCI1919948.1 electron transport complex subunit E [Enterococcaceae bacterium]MDM8214436.1 electron transport complex subunit E [Enterococcus hirae]
MEETANSNSLGKIFSAGILKENPVLRLVLGTCPTLAVTTAVFNGLGMGLAATFVLICSNSVISLLRKAIPNQVRLPAFIVIIASFVTVIQMLIKAYLPALDDALGVYLPLITVNCIILGRAEMFASKNTVVASAADGLGMGLGFTIVLVLMSGIRELLGAGSLMGLAILPSSMEPLRIMAMPPGGFLVFGLLMAGANWLEHRLAAQPSGPIENVCGVCPSSSHCGLKEEA